MEPRILDDFLNKLGSGGSAPNVPSGDLLLLDSSKSAIHNSISKYM